MAVVLCVEAVEAVPLESNVPPDVTSVGDITGDASISAPYEKLLPKAEGKGRLLDEFSTIFVDSW